MPTNQSASQLGQVAYDQRWEIDVNKQEKYAAEQCEQNNMLMMN